MFFCEGGLESKQTFHGWLAKKRGRKQKLLPGQICWRVCETLHCRSAPSGLCSALSRRRLWGTRLCSVPGALCLAGLLLPQALPLPCLCLGPLHGGFVLRGSVGSGMNPTARPSLGSERPPAGVCVPHRMDQLCYCRAWSWEHNQGTRGHRWCCSVASTPSSAGTLDLWG